MTIKIIIDRQFKEPPDAEDIRIFNDLRIRAMGRNGYISGETLVDVDDNKKVVVLSVWSSMEDWTDWRNSREREKLETELSAHLVEPATIRVFMLGADSLREMLTQILKDKPKAA